MLSALRGHVCFEVVLWRCGDATYYSVLKSKTLSVLLQYYSVLQSTTPVLLKVLLQYYSVLESNTPVLLRTTPVLQSTTPVLIRTAPAWSSSHMKRHFQCEEQAKPPSNLTKYCACHAKWISWVIRVTYETSFTMRRASKCTLELHQILHLPRKRISWMMCVTYEPSFPMRGASQVTICLHHYCACHEILRPIFPVKLPEVLPPKERRFEDIRGYSQHNPKISEQKIVISHPPLRRPDSSHPGDAFCMKKYNISHSGYLPKCHELLGLPRKVTLQPHQILRLPRTMNLMIDPRDTWNVIYNARSKQSHPATSPNSAPATKFWVQDFTTKSLNCFRQYKDDSRISEDIRTENRHLAPAASETWLVPSWRRILYEKIQNFALRLSPKMSRSAAPATKSHTAPAPNSAPATQNECHQWSASHMQRHFQCAQQAKPPSNLTKYCACHESLSSGFHHKIPELLPRI